MTPHPRTPTKPHAYVSVIGVALISPLLRLLEDLQKLKVTSANDVQVSLRENGLSAAVVVLAVTIMESALNRTRYVRRNKPRRGESSADYFMTVVGRPNLASDLEEAVAVRDAIINNHIWKAFVGPGPDRRLTFYKVPVLRRGYGDMKFRKVRKRGTRVTRRLGFNLFPSRIDRRDARLVVKTVSTCLQALEAKKRLYFPIRGTHFDFRRASRTFYEIAASLPV